MPLKFYHTSNGRRTATCWSRRPLTNVSSWAVLDGEDLAQVLLFLGKALLQALQLVQTFGSLVLQGTYVLNKIELGLGGVVAKDTVVKTAFPLQSALVLLKVLQREAQNKPRPR